MHDMDMCQMNMMFTWDWRNSCVIYEWWHVKTVPGFLGTLSAIVFFSVLYEYFRFRVARWRSHILAPTMATASVVRVSAAVRARSAALYAVQVGYSFMLMLVFMTYNGWYMGAVVIGAGIGFYVWGDGSDSKSMVCH